MRFRTSCILQKEKIIFCVLQEVASLESDILQLRCSSQFFVYGETAPKRNVICILGAKLGLLFLY